LTRLLAENAALELVNRFDDRVRHWSAEVEQRLPVRAQRREDRLALLGGTVVDHGNRKDAAEAELLRDLVDRRSVCRNVLTVTPAGALAANARA
jgi:hypothetical protein